MWTGTHTNIWNYAIQFQTRKLVPLKPYNFAKLVFTCSNETVIQKKVEI
jgi:hypothetical protein